MIDNTCLRRNHDLPKAPVVGSMLDFRVWVFNDVPPRPPVPAPPRLRFHPDKRPWSSGGYGEKAQWDAKGSGPGQVGLLVGQLFAW